MAVNNIRSDPPHNKGKATLFMAHSAGWLASDVSCCQPPSVLLVDLAPHATLSSPSTISGQVLYEPLPAVSWLLSSADKVYPHKVVQALEQGMLEYIPLDLLTDEVC